MPGFHPIRKPYESTNDCNGSHLCGFSRRDLLLRILLEALEEGPALPAAGGVVVFAEVVLAGRSSVPGSIAAEDSSQVCRCELMGCITSVAEEGVSKRQMIRSYTPRTVFCTNGVAFLLLLFHA